VKEGEIGTLLSVKYRAAHAGPKEIGCSEYFYGWLYDRKLNGAGALMDYCCYGAVLARYALGQPSRVTGVKGRIQKEYISLEDNALIVMQWPRAMAVTEGSWTQVGHLTAYSSVFYGTEGTLVAEQTGAKKLWLATEKETEGREVEVPESDPDERNATEYFLSRLEKGLPVEGMCDPRVSRDAQEILEAGLISASTGQAISLPLPLPRG
jgi:predicted dehydrogenase